MCTINTSNIPQHQIIVGAAFSLPITSEIMWGTSYLDEGEDVLIIDLKDLKKEYDHLFIDQVCERLAKKSKKVIFKLKEVDHVLCMKEFVKDLQRMQFLSRLPQEITDCVTEKEKHYSSYLHFWPDSWYIHVFLAGNRETKLLIPFALWTLPNVELICLEGSWLKEIPDFNYISQMKSLKVLNVERNDLRSLPSTLCLCEKLEELRVAETSLSGLPACIRKMDKIKRITRLDASYRNMFLLDPAIHDGYPVKSVYSCDGKKMETISENNNKTSSPDTLFNLAGYATLKTEQDILSPSPSLKLPIYVVNELRCSLKKLKFCDHCNCGFSEKEYYTVKKNFRDFIGYKNIVFEAVACSSFCCESIYDEWTKLAEKEKDLQCKEQYCFDVEITENDNNNVIVGDSNVRENWFHRNVCCF